MLQEGLPILVHLAIALLRKNRDFNKVIAWSFIQEQWCLYKNSFPLLVCILRNVPWGWQETLSKKNSSKSSLDTPQGGRSFASNELSVFFSADRDHYRKLSLIKIMVCCLAPTDICTVQPLHLRFKKNKISTVAQCLLI